MLNEAVQYDRETREQNRYRGMNPEFYRKAARKANERAARERRERAAEDRRRKLAAIEAAKAARAAEIERTEAERVAVLEAKASEVAKTVTDQHRPYAMTIDRVVRLACRVFNVTRVELISSRRDRELVFARQFVMYWARRRTPHSLPMIGKRLGDRDHTTVIHGSRRYSDKRAEMGRTLRSFGDPKRQLSMVERAALRKEASR